MIITTFEDDMDKVTDLMQFIIQANSDIPNSLANTEVGVANFKQSYIYLTEGEVESTLKKIKSAEVLAYLYRQAENLYIDEINGRYTPWVIKGEQAKDIINSFAEFILTPNQYKEFIDELYQMGC